MYITTRKEQFSLAYIHALAAVAGLNIKTSKVDDDSVDVDLAANRKVGTKRHAPHLAIQAKCTETDDEAGDYLPFALKMKNYDDLRDEHVHIPRILVVLTVPPELQQWVDERPRELAMRRCAFYFPLAGMPPSENEVSETVRIPRTQRLTVESLTAMMNRIGEGGAP